MTMQKVEAALEPFAKEADRYEPDEGDANDTAWDSHPTIGELRAARDALALIRSDAQGERAELDDYVSPPLKNMRTMKVKAARIGRVLPAPLDAATPSASDWEAGAQAMREACAKWHKDQSGTLCKPDGSTHSVKSIWHLDCSETMSAIPIPRRP